jgi:mono/diheme cytochrome c family protein
MRRAIGGFILVLLALGSAGFYVLTAPTVIPQELLPARSANLANGETVFNAGGCASCHATPNQGDRTRLGGGLALATAFGTFRVPNISPDKEHGIGAWSEQAFASAMLRGTGPRGEHLYPAFPYTSYQRMRLEDVRDLFAYLKTLPPDATPSMPHQLRFPYNLRRGIGAWKLLYLDGKPFAPDPSKDTQFNRGAYLVEALAHCAECHSPRDAFGGIVPDKRFSGGPNPVGKGWIPNITPHSDGLAAWSDKDIAYLLETGFTPDGDSVGSDMATVVESTAKLSSEDRAAIAAYIKALPPRPGKAPSKKDERG